MNFDIADNGTLVYVPGEPVAYESWAVRWAPGDSAAVAVAGGHRLSAYRVSPDGTRLLGSTVQEDHVVVQLLDLRRGTRQPLSDPDFDAFWPVCGADGRTAFFNSASADGPWLNLCRFDLDSGWAERLTRAARNEQAYSVSADGRTLFFHRGGNVGNVDIHALDLATREATSWLASPYNELHPAISPDGPWLAYASDVSGGFEVYLARYPDRGTPLRISPDGGWEPMWGPDGALYYRSLDGDRVFRVRIGAGWPPAVEAPELLLEGDFSPGRPYGRPFDIGPDGTMYLRKSSTSSVPGSTVRVVLNWVQQLETSAALQ